MTSELFPIVVAQTYEASQHDDVGFGEIIGAITYDDADQRRSISDVERVQLALAVVKHLLLSGDFEAGNFTAAEEGGFIPWHLPTDDVCAHVEAAIESVGIDSHDCFGRRFCVA